MFDLSFEVIGYQRVANNMRKLISAERTYFAPTLRGWAEDTSRYLRGYPYPARRGDYIRTYKLKRGFDFEMQGDSQVSFINTATNEKGFKYPDVVVFAGNQVWFHAGRWWTVDQVVETRMGNLRDDLYRRVAADWS